MVLASVFYGVTVRLAVGLAWLGLAFRDGFIPQCLWPLVRDDLNNQSRKACDQIGAYFSTGPLYVSWLPQSMEVVSGKLGLSHGR